MGSEPTAGPPAYDVDLESAWPKTTDFAAHYDKESLTFLHPVPSEQALPEAGVGELLSVLLIFIDRRAKIRIHARLLERRLGGAERGLLLAFLPEESSRIELVNVCAEGESIPYQRRAHERVACQIPARLEVPGAGPALDCLATNVSERGAFLATRALVEAESLARLTLHPRRGTSLELRVRVASVVHDGVEEGLGVEFFYRSSAEKQLMKDEVARLRGSSSSKT